MKISIITATYNSQESVESTIASVLLQSYTDIEYIIIDGGSTDRTLAIIDKYRDRISKIISEPDNGIYDALNKGLRVATGDVIGFLHADDTFASPDVLDRVAESFADSKVRFMYGDLVYVDIFDEKIVRKWISDPFHHKLLSRGWMPPHPTVYCRRNIYDEFGMFNTKYNISADYDFVMRVLSRLNTSAIAYNPQIMVRMRIGGTSNRSFKNIVQKSSEDLQIIKRNNIGGVYTLIRKNVGKLLQFFVK